MQDGVFGKFRVAVFLDFDKGAADTDFAGRTAHNDGHVFHIVRQQVDKAVFLPFTQGIVNAGGRIRAGAGFSAAART